MLLFFCLFIVFFIFFIGFYLQFGVLLKLGLIFFGGGVKGLVYIGVFKVLEEYGIFLDYIIGMSMGSIVGGFYFIGYMFDELEQFVIFLNWNRYFNDSYVCNYLFIDECFKVDCYQFFFVLEDGKLKIFRGLIGGKKIFMFFIGFIVCVYNQQFFDEFYWFFCCVVIDFEIGEVYVFFEGLFCKGICVSMLILLVFDLF